MSNRQEAWDEDMDYLYLHCERIGVLPTEEQEEAFNERVSIKEKDGGIKVQEARRQAFKEMFGGL